MMRCLFAIMLFAFAGAALAAPADLQALLKEVQQAQQHSAQINSKRVQRFIHNKAQQAELLRQAKADLRPVKARTDSLRGEFTSLQTQLQNLKKEFQDKAGDLSQLSAVVDQTVSNLRATATQSLITAQYPQRLDTIRQLANLDSVPTAAQLKQLWFLLQQEMTATGTVTTFQAPVVSSEADAGQQQVTRVGPFAVFTQDGKYLRYVTGIGLKQLARQPGFNARAKASDLAGATQGIHPVVIDSAHGSALQLLQEKPTLWERILQGGGIGALTIALGILALILAAVQLLRLARVHKQVKRQLGTVGDPSDDNPLGRVLLAARDVDADDVDSLELKLDEAVMREVPPLQWGQSLIKLITVVAPMLGLLGTVVGMIIVFQVITTFGNSDPGLLAGGISKALVTTVLGLVVAIPLLFVHSLLVSRSRDVIRVLEEQTAGLLARFIESDRRSAGHA